MARQILKQPNGLYAEYSTISDCFVLYDATAEEIVEEAKKEAAKDAERNTRNAISKVDNGEVSFLGLSWEDAVANHNRNYPDEPLNFTN
jgi:ADP-ribosylglycohydrolase